MKVFINLLTASLLSILLVGCATLQDAGGEKRVAMVIGNNDYPQLAEQLTKSVKDAQDMKQALKDLGFKVYYGENLSFAQMKTLLNGFTQEIDDKTLAFVYFSGHGRSDQQQQRNFLIPSDFANRELKDKALSVDEIASKMKNKGSSKNILALDMCRDTGQKGINPNQKGSKSLGGGDIAIDSPFFDKKEKFHSDGILISYSTAVGSTSMEYQNENNSRYTEVLLKYINNTSLSLSDLFGQVSTEVSQKSGQAQTPWKTGSLEGNDIFLAKRTMRSAGGAKP